MARRVRCNCQGWPECKLCHGTKFYQYEPGPRGWIPFPCPTCGGKGKVRPEGKPEETCLTCRGHGVVDPAQPYVQGFWQVLRKALLGA